MYFIPEMTQLIFGGLNINNKQCSTFTFMYLDISDREYLAYREVHATNEYLLDQLVSIKTKYCYLFYQWPIKNRKNGYSIVCRTFPCQYSLFRTSLFERPKCNFAEKDIRRIFSFDHSALSFHFPFCFNLGKKKKWTYSGQGRKKSDLPTRVFCHPFCLLSRFVLG